MGYHRAGFEVVGVDIKPQPRYPFEFHQADAMTYPLDGFDAIHASPPCQAYSVAAASRRNEGHEYPDLVASTRARLQANDAPWIIENVPGAPVRADFLLCGSQFGLKIVRHRLFEVSWPVTLLMPPCSHDRDSVSIVGHGTPSWVRKDRIKRGLHPNISVAEKRDRMEMPWADRYSLSLAIPPAYTEFIGKHLLEYMKGRAA